MDHFKITIHLTSYMVMNVKGWREGGRVYNLVAVQNMCSDEISASWPLTTEEEDAVFCSMLYHVSTSLSGRGRHLMSGWSNAIVLGWMLRPYCACHVLVV